MKRYLMLVPVLLIFGCSEPNKPQDIDLTVVFRMMDGAGNEPAEYRLGEEIFFEFLVVNQTGVDQAWTREHDWPVARFTLYRDSALFGATYETGRYRT